MSRIRFGIVGTGGIARHHAVALQALAADAELAACADVQLDRAREFAAAFGIPRVYDSARAMLDAGGLDVICVCTPHPQHAEPLILAAERGVHGVVEKPFTTTVADADRVLEAAARYGTKLSVISQRRWLPAARRIRAAIDAGKLGNRIILGESYCEMWRGPEYYARDAWRGRWDTEGGGVLMNQSPHNIDFLLYYMGPAEEIFGYWANLNHPYVEIEDNAVAVIRFKSGGLGILKGTVSMNPPRRIHGVTLVGDNGATVSLDCWEFATGQNDIWTIPGDEPYLEQWRKQDREYGTGELPNLHAYQLRDVIEAIRTGREPAVTGEDGRRVVAIIQGVYESGRSGRPVRL
ncbi:MAG TPA: Gfo/Idh/MocA family oxidoreductase [Isosphaeraceae bacterium]|jgi:UDP-N-acetyl-2-amino-2-deoxyglucuronate dehydrogenase|nr:Gfo/Idh/MocA family oxidoreductase [Isosphaeraceae bacterium]